MMYRISSMYNHARKIIVLLLSAFAIEFVDITVASLYLVRSGSCKTPPTHLSLFFSLMVVFAVTPAPPQANICPRSKVHLGFVIWISIGLFELLVLGLAVKVALNYFHSIRQIHMWHKNSLVYVLLRDSVVFPLM